MGSSNGLFHRGPTASAVGKNKLEERKWEGRMNR
jgi:hypothetical protein